MSDNETHIEEEKAESKPENLVPQAEPRVGPPAGPQAKQNAKSTPFGVLTVEEQQKQLARVLKYKFSN